MNYRGFTLLDLITTCAILGILVGVALPNFVLLIKHHQSTTAINTLVGAVNYARLEALRRGKTVSLCPVGPTASCGSSWHRGLIIFSDSDSNGTLDPEDEIVRTYPPFPDGSTLKLSSFGSNRHLKMAPSGLTHSQNGTFKYCPPDGNSKFAKLAFINKAGRARLATDTDGNGILNHAGGADVDCSI